MRCLKWVLHAIGSHRALGVPSRRTPQGPNLAGAQACTNQECAKSAAKLSQAVGTALGGISSSKKGGEEDRLRTRALGEEQIDAEMPRQVQGGGLLRFKQKQAALGFSRRLKAAKRQQSKRDEGGQQNLQQAHPCKGVQLVTTLAFGKPVDCRNCGEGSHQISCVQNMERLLSS